MKCDSDTYCPLAVSFAGRNMSFIPQHRTKNGQSHGCHNSKLFVVLSCTRYAFIMFQQKI